MLTPLLIASFLALATHLFVKLRHKRCNQYAYLPQLPPSLLLGHLKTMKEYMRRGAANRHPDMIFSEMHEKLERPPLLFLDLRPAIKYPMVVVTNHAIAEQVSKASSLFPTSAPKSSLKYLEHLIGPKSMISSHGEEWKTLRKRFSPGFAPQHLVTLLPCILDRMVPFIDHLDNYARTQEEFSLVPLIVNLTFDIIGTIVMDTTLEAQHSDPSKQGELVRLFNELLGTYSNERVGLPWWFTRKTQRKRRRLGERIDELIKDTIRRKFTEHREESLTKGKSRSVLALSLGDAESLSPELIDVTCDQLKTFLLAGHDTTSVTLAWAIYELSLNPHALAAVRAELDELMGTDASPEAVRSHFLSSDGPELVQKMAYISAVIKETLRLHPPAATARQSEHGTGFTVRAPTGEDYCLDGMIIYNCATIIQRDPAIYGDSADRFLPERWLQEGEARKAPASAWRPFERGPRNCIGQELANIEARVIIAYIARRYEFTKVGLGEITRDGSGRPVTDENGTYQVKLPVYNMRQVTSKPVDEMRIKVIQAGKSN
ncbi:cytochrome P450 [Xylaria intraflava]|nr:cytochrome P450 [Xylaria intraflava]